MKTLTTTLIIVAAIAASLTARPATAQTPAPAAGVQFALPLADSTTAVAVILPATPGRAWLVYATTRGLIGFCPMGETAPPSPTPSPTPQPQPQPTPPPPPTPTPPYVVPPLPDWIIPGAARRDRTCTGVGSCK
jgi:hypothetical protein